MTIRVNTSPRASRGGFGECPNTTAIKIILRRSASPGTASEAGEAIRLTCKRRCSTMSGRHFGVLFVSKKKGSNHPSLIPRAGVAVREAINDKSDAHIFLYFPFYASELIIYEVEVGAKTRCNGEQMEAIKCYYVYYSSFSRCLRDSFESIRQFGCGNDRCAFVIAPRAPAGAIKKSPCCSLSRYFIRAAIIKPGSDREPRRRNDGRAKTRVCRD